jgi:hypothetical protein
MITNVAIPRSEVGNKITLWLEHPEHPERFYCIGSFWGWDKAGTVSVEKMLEYQNQSHVVVINLEKSENDETNRS